MTKNDPASVARTPPRDVPFAISGWRKIAAWVAVWTFLGLLQAARLYFVYQSDGEQLISWPQALTWALADWYLWGIVSFLVVRVTRQTTFERHTWPRDVALHLIAAPLIGALQLLLYTLVYRPLGSLFEHRIGTSHEWTFGLVYEDLLRGKLHGAVLTYFLIAFVVFSLRYAARFHAAERRRQQIETRLIQAQLDALKMQLHPHFLFNTLNAITALIHSDPESADRMTGRLAQLLRTTLDQEAVQEVPLRQELEFLDGYLDIQRMRFGDRLRVEIDAAPETLDAFVPNLILQPLVENAVQHGVAPRSAPGTVGFRARCVDGRLLLEVFDDGPGIRDLEGKNETGVGLSNTGDRLRQLYPDDHHFDLQNGNHGGLCVKIDIPFRHHPVVASRP